MRGYDEGAMDRFVEYKPLFSHTLSQWVALVDRHTFGSSASRWRSRDRVDSIARRLTEDQSKRVWVSGGHRGGNS